MKNNDIKLIEINKVIALRNEGRHLEAFEALSKIASRGDDFILQSRYTKILSTLDGSVLSKLTPLKVALLSSTTDKFLRDILKFWIALAGFNAEFFESTYDAIAQTILDADGKLYQFDPDIVWIFTTYRDVQTPVRFERSQDQVLKDIDDVIHRYVSLWNALQQRSRAYIIQNNADIPSYRTLGNFEAIAHWSNANILRQYNSRLVEALPAGVTVFDLDHSSALYGKERWFELTQWYNSRIPFDLDAAGEVAYQATQLIAAIKGRARKCVVLDLDNTVWGGVIGDDGLDGICLGDGPIGEAFVDFQKYLLGLKERGVILAVCSKNDKMTAQEPFFKHPDMLLKLEDISVFRANWENKAENIREISRLLNIGMDSIVFVDDNPAERELVKKILPQVAVPDMPDDPAYFRQTLDRFGYFETAGISVEDSKRTEYYRSNVAREDLKNDFTDLASYLRGLEMEARVGCFDDFHLPRVAQLINKSNQFHLTTKRYTENEVKELARNPDVICRYFSLKDKFGDNGLIAVVIMKKSGGHGYVIDTWCMSCRVLSRGMEEYICQTMIELAMEKGARRIVGIYLPTAKNGLVADLYPRLGFNKISETNEGGMHWQLDLDPAPRYTTYINTAVK